jgi:hypothetical protein
VEQTASPREYVSGLLKRARAARDHGQTTAMPASPYAPPARAPRQSTGSGPLAQGPKGGRHLPGLGPHAAEAWQRWELVPGVELHVRTDAEWRYRELIRRILAETQAFEKER